MRVCILQCACLDFPLLWSFSLEVWLAVVQSQVLSFLCVCVNLLSLGGAVERFHVQWNVISVTVRPCVCLQRSSVVSMTWLIVPQVWGLGSLSSHHNGPPPSTGLLYFYCHLTNRLSLSDYSFSVYVRAPQPSCCKNTFLLMTTKPNCQLKIKQNKHSITV